MYGRKPVRIALSMDRSMSSPVLVQEIKRLNNDGTRLFNNGDIQGAFNHFARAISLYPGSAATLNNIGLIYWRIGKKEKAYTSLRKAAAINPSDLEIVVNFGTIARACGRTKDFSSLFLNHAAHGYDTEAMGAYIDLTLLEESPTKQPTTACQRPKQVVFIANKPISREGKLAWGLKQAGFEVVLIHNESPNFNASRYCSEIVQYQSPAHALEIAERYNPMVYHIFATWNYAMPALLTRHKPGKIVIDDYDIMAGMVKSSVARQQYPGNIELERFCLENADGLCCRSLEAQYAKRHMGYAYKGKRLFLLDGCWYNKSTALERTPKIDDGHLHFVYCGNMSTETTGPYDYHQDVALLLSKHHIHYHIYPYYEQCRSILTEKFHHYILKNGGHPEYVHLHHPVASDDLIREISRYHYGLHLMWPNPIGNPDDYPYELRGFDFGSTNKIFDYMDAGLPIFVHPGKLQKFIVERYGNGQAISVLDDLVVNTIPDSPPVPYAFQMEPNIRRLIRFYAGL